MNNKVKVEWELDEDDELHKDETVESMYDLRVDGPFVFRRHPRPGPAHSKDCCCTVVPGRIVVSSGEADPVTTDEIELVISQLETHWLKWREGDIETAIELLKSLKQEKEKS